MRAISATTKLVGLFGHPVGHSLSPAMHNAAFAALDLDCVYMAFDIRPGDIERAMSALPALGLLGVNVTIPYKEAVLPLLDTVTPEAAHSGAVNTIVVDDGRLVGYNTDGVGFIRSLAEEAGEDPAGKTVLLLGAGGACRAVAAALAFRGAARIIIANRDVARAVAVAGAVNQVQGGIAAAVPLTEEEVARAMREAQVVIQTTPVGMYPRVDEPPVVNPELLRPGQLVCDLIYNPRQTAFLAGASRRGCRTLSGLGMLLFQGVEAFGLWTHQDPPVDVMRRVLEEHLARRGRSFKQ